MSKKKYIQEFHKKRFGTELQENTGWIEDMLSDYAKKVVKKNFGKRIVMRCAKEVPTTWLDPALTGKTKVVGEPPYGCPDVEKLLNEIKRRIEAVKAKNWAKRSR